MSEPGYSHRLLSFLKRFGVSFLIGCCFVGTFLGDEANLSSYALDIYALKFVGFAGLGAIVLAFLSYLFDAPLERRYVAA